MTQRELEILILNIYKIRLHFPTTYYNVATTWYNVLQRCNNVVQRGYNLAKTWHAAEICILFSERGDQKRGTTARTKRDTMTGPLEVFGKQK